MLWITKLICRAALSVWVLLLPDLAVAKPPAAAAPDFCELFSRVSELDLNKDLRFDNMTRQENCLVFFWIESSFSSAEDLLNSLDFKSYKRALERNECETALQLVRAAFIEKYPSAPSINENEAVFESWRNNALGIHYPEVSICLERKEFAELEKKIARDRLSSEPYRGLTATMAPELLPFYPDPLFGRHFYILGWEARVSRIGHASTALTLLKLSRHGQAVRYDTATEFYLASLLKREAHSDPVIDEVLALPLPPEERAKVEKALRTNNFSAVVGYRP